MTEKIAPALRKMHTKTKYLLKQPKPTEIKIYLRPASKTIMFFETKEIWLS